MATRLILLIAVAAIFSSCATYRSGFTPDDVYYSPERERNSYVEYDAETHNPSGDDLRLRQQIRDARFRTLDDADLWVNTRPWWNNPFQGVHQPWWNNPFQGIHRPFWNNGWGGNPWLFGNSFSTWNQPFFIIPGTTTVIRNNGSVQKTTSQPRYTPGIRTLPSRPSNQSSSGWNGKFNTRPSDNGSRFFGGSTNQTNRGYRFSGSPSSGGSGRTFSPSSSPTRSSSGSGSGTRGRRH